MTQQTTNNRFVVPDLTEFISRRMNDISARINCLTIGTVISFDSTKQTAVISVNFQKTIKGINPTQNIGEVSDVIINYPTLVNVPVVFMNGGGGYLTFPVSEGDTCILLFCDRDMDIWFATGQIAPPNSERVHDINDAIAIIGIKNLQQSLGGYDTANIKLGTPSAYVTVPLTNTGIIHEVDVTGERLNQAGFLQPYAGASAPSGWLLCYGQAISRTTYANLFSVIGTTWGSGDGSTTFNVPDLRGRTVAGLDNMGGSNANVLTNTYNPNRNTLGGNTGEEAHQLTVAELAKHNHAYYAPLGSTSLNTGGGGNANNLNSTYLTGDTGNDVPHQNVQPTKMVNWIIKL